MVLGHLLDVLISGPLINFTKCLQKVKGVHAWNLPGAGSGLDGGKHKVNLKRKNHRGRQKFVTGKKTRQRAWSSEPLKFGFEALISKPAGQEVALQRFIYPGSAVVCVLRSFVTFYFGVLFAVCVCEFCVCTPVFWPGESHGLSSPRGRKESRTRPSDFDFHFPVLKQPVPAYLFCSFFQDAFLFFSLKLIKTKRAARKE